MHFLIIILDYSFDYLTIISSLGLFAVLSTVLTSIKQGDFKVSYIYGTRCVYKSAILHACMYMYMYFIADVGTLRIIIIDMI